MSVRRLLSPLALASLVLLAGCQDLAVTNPNEPDRTRVTSQPDATEALISSAFGVWWPWSQHYYPTNALSCVADETTNGFADYGELDASSEPRTAFNNSSQYTREAVARDPWNGLLRVVSNVNDALAALNRGVPVADSMRARAVAKFVQGLAHGYLALYFDSAFVVTEATDLEANPPQLLPYPVVMDTALSELSQAITLAAANTFDLPVPGWLYTTMTNQDLARLAHSYRARLRASVARSRAERVAVDWDQVVTDIDAGVVQDFAPQAIAGEFVDNYKRLLGRQRVGIPGDFGRIDYWLVGPADSTGGFINWVNTPVADRVPFQLRTQDRRIHPAGNPAGIGLYAGYTTTNRWAASRGTYHQTRYYLKRFGVNTAWQDSLLPVLTLTEMNLLKAEALIRLNRAAEAVPLINITRVANGQLPPVTIDGPPDVAGCVPRKVMPGPMQGQCGSLWDALRYEKRIEMMGVTAVVAYADARGWQALVENSFVQLPIPGDELDVLRKAYYSYGGGGPGSAPAPDPEHCPTQLNRCP
jgi:hypothetical protein